MTYIIQRDPKLIYAETVIEEKYGDIVSVFDKKKSLTKFGRNEEVGTGGATIMTLPSGLTQETTLTTNAITTISSSSVSDTEVVTIEGHTISGTDLTFVTQNATLNGQTQVSLSTPIARVSRVFHASLSSTNLVGTVYVYETDTTTAGVPDTNTKIHIIIKAGKNQSQKASTSISSTDYWIVAGFTGAVLEKVAAFADIVIQTREVGSVYIDSAAPIAITAGGSNSLEFNPYLIVPKNHDVRLFATASASNTDVTGTMQGYLASIIT